MQNKVEPDTVHKLETNGNDFLIAQKENHTPSWIKKIANRHLGIGCDQVLIITKPQNVFFSIKMAHLLKCASMAFMHWPAFYTKKTTPHGIYTPNMQFSQQKYRRKNC